MTIGLSSRVPGLWMTTVPSWFATKITLELFYNSRRLSRRDLVFYFLNLSRGIFYLLNPPRLHLDLLYPPHWLFDLLNTSGLLLNLLNLPHRLLYLLYLPHRLLLRGAPPSRITPSIPKKPIHLPLLQHLGILWPF